MGNITIQGDITATVPGNAVGGASALTTVGSVPFVTAAGVLGQSANLFWDSGSSRFRIGGTVAGFGEFRNASNAVVAFYGTASGFMATGTATDLGLRSTSAILFATNGDNERARFTASGNLLLGTTTDDGVNRLQVAGSVAINGASFGQVISGVGDFFLTNTAAAGGVIIRANGVEGIRLATTTRNVLIGGSSDGNFRFDVQSSGLSGTGRFYDQTPTTGSTSLVVRAGAGQSGNLQTWQNSSGTALTYIGSDGAMRVSATFYAVLNSAGSLNEAVYGTEVQLASGRSFLFSATTDAAAAKDLGFRRFAAGRLELNSGTAIGTTPANARDIMARGFFAAETTTDPSAADLSIAGSNAQDTFRLYMKNDKLVIAYQRSGTVNYLTIPLDGATTTFTQSTTAP